MSLFAFFRLTPPQTLKMLLLGEFLIKFSDFFTKLLFSATSQNATVMSMLGEKSEVLGSLT